VLGATFFPPSDIVAMDLADGRLQWSGLLGAQLGDEYKPVVVSGGKAFVATTSDVVVFDAGGCGQFSCQPLWRTDLPGDRQDVDAIVADGVLLVRSALYFFGGPRDLAAFDADGCGEPTCPPLWTTEAVLDTQDRAFGADPAAGLGAAGGLVFVGGVDHRLYAYPTSGCAASPCPPAWTSKPLRASITGMAVTHDRVYVKAGGGPLAVLAAAGCGMPTCGFLWTANDGGTSVSVAGELAWTVDWVTTDGTAVLRAFDAGGCGSRRCRPLAEIDATHEPCQPQGTPVVVGGRIYLNGDLCLLTYGLPPA
jgi:outer membrane protein assembly factor BamB